MPTATTEHYRAYSPKPFTRAERESVTVVFGGLHWRIERVIQAVLENGGNRAQVLPVATKEDLLTGRVEITAQNHGFAVDPKSVEKGGLVETHVNLNDGTSEGMRHRELPVFSVQYHPEASPGPHDSHYLFERFVTIMEGTRGG